MYYVVTVYQNQLNRIKRFGVKFFQIFISDIFDGIDDVIQPHSNGHLVSKYVVCCYHTVIVNPMNRTWILIR